MPPSADATRARLVGAGERLFAEKGIDAVSLREITREAGARNTVALQHHFGDRDGLLMAIAHKHLPAIEVERHALLDALTVDTESNAWSYAEALVRPLASCLDGRDGGTEFLQIYADLMNRPRPVLDLVAQVEREDSLERWRNAVGPLLSPGADRVHRRYATILYTVIELARHARSDRAPDIQVISAATTDVVAASLIAPVSRETKRALTRRDAHQKKARS